jgi:pyruvate dehydrogenase E2 component (dihydrolipoamide acetyltransferase)
MISEVIMPKLGQTMEEGRVVEWLKAEGDQISRGDLLFTLESDKASLDVEATGRGWLRRIVVGEDEVVPVLTVVALVTSEPDEDISGWKPAGSGTEAVPEAGPTALPSPTHELTVADGGTAPISPTGGPDATDRAGSPPPAGRIIASPRARRLAADRGVDLGLVSGTGPGGRIVEADVLAAAAQPSAGITQAPPSGTVPLTGLRGIIAERMTVSARTIPQVTLTTEVDADNLLEAHGRLKAVESEWGFAPGLTEVLAFLAVRALTAHPGLNARLSADGQAIELLRPISPGLAVDTERGLLVPVVADAGELDLRTFITRARALIDRAREGTSLPDDLTGGTFTVTSLGAFGIDAFTPLINPPEAAILGVGRIREKPAVFAGRITPRPLLTLSLGFDHRIVDGAPAARFLQHLGELITHPEEILEVTARHDPDGTSVGNEGEAGS